IGTKDFGIANIYRSIILNNSSIVGGAAYTSDQSSIRLLNSIFWENVADSAGGGLYTTKGALHLVANSVLWNNSPEEIYSYTTPILLANKILIRNSDIEGGEEGIQHHQRDSIFYFENNFDVDPGFAFPDTMNFHYSEESPCVDAGTHFLVYYGDTLMNLSEEEYDGVAPDVGVHEYDGPREIQEQDLSPRSFALLNAYPNPFNSTLTVVCQLPKSSKATLSLVNIRGQELMTLYSGTKHSGEYRLNLSLRDYPSGTYFLRLQSPGEDLLKRVQLMK
ncbi:T9SS type A sorting domain-containing protein, partial [bacterium]|nr:T9SS type A sorting domain-containing protein [bacterium]